VRLPDPTISDPHAKITVEEHHFVLWDFGSANGTFVNGRRIREATPIKENDEIRFGNTLVVLKTLT
jgi:pSer/pThr/pTyr-binding forkhead associated (FHA) protein